MSTIYYLYTYLYCDALLGQPFCTKRFCSHVHHEGKHISTAVAKTERLHTQTHSRTHTHKSPTEMHTSHSMLPASCVTTTQARFRDINKKDSPPLSTYCTPHLPLSLNLVSLFPPYFFLTKIFVFCVKVPSIFLIFRQIQTHKEGHSMYCC